MIELALRAPLMAAIGASTLLQAGLLLAGPATVALSPVAPPAQEEHRAALASQTEPLP